MNESGRDAKDLWIGAAIGFGCVVAYVASAARYILGGDNAEFVLLAEKGGVAHPSGYPLYLLVLRLAAWLPFSPPLRAALVTCVIGAATVAAVFLAARRLGASRFAASFTCVALALSPRMWIAATHAEVFALNALIAGLMVLVIATTECAAATRACLLGILAGFGFANHLTIILLAPLGIVGMARAVYESAPHRVRATLLALLSFAVGLSPYALLRLEAGHNHPWSWGHPESVSAIWDHLTRADYGTFSLGIASKNSVPIMQLQLLALSIARDLVWLPVALLPIGIGSLFVRRSSQDHRWSRVECSALLLTFLTTGPLLVSRFNVLPEGLGRTVLERFYLLPEVVVTLIMALGLTWLLRHVPDRIAGPPRAILAVVSMLTLAIFQGLTTLPQVREHHSSAVESYLKNIYKQLPPSAILLGEGDHLTFGMAYLRNVQQLRPDVCFISPILLLYPWYSARVQHDLRLQLPQVIGRHVDLVRVVEMLLSTQRPVYVVELPSKRLLETFPSYPEGLLIRILPRSAAVPLPEQVEALNASLLQRYALDYPVPQNPCSWAWHVHQQYSRPWRALIAMYRATGRGNRAAVLQSQLDLAYPAQ